VARQLPVVRRTMLWQLRRCELLVLDRGAQADARPAARVDNCSGATHAEATPAVQKNPRRAPTPLDNR
jgi:hypothetical protein